MIRKILSSFILIGIIFIFSSCSLTPTSQSHSSASSQINSKTQSLQSGESNVEEYTVVLISDSQEGKKYEVSTFISNIKENNTLSPTRQTFPFYITIPTGTIDEMYVISLDTPGVYGEIVTVIQLRSKQSSLSLSQYNDTLSERYIQIDTGTFVDKNDEIFFNICKTTHEYIYSYLVPLDKEKAVYIAFYTKEYNREADEPLFRSIVNTITK